MYKDKGIKADIVYLYDYHKYWLYVEGDKIKNPSFDKHSSDLLDFKKNDNDYLIQRFANEVDSVIEDGDFAICSVPSCDASKKVTAVSNMVKKLTNGKQRIDASSCIVRHTTM